MNWQHFCLVTLGSQSIFLGFCLSRKIIDQFPKDIGDSGKLHIIWLVKVAVEILNLPSIFLQKLCKGGKKRKRKGSKERKPCSTLWFSLPVVNLRYILADWTAGCSWQMQFLWPVSMWSLRSAWMISWAVESLGDSCSWRNFSRFITSWCSLSRNRDQSATYSVTTELA